MNDIRHLTISGVIENARLVIVVLTMVKHGRC